LNGTVVAGRRICVFLAAAGLAWSSVLAQETPPTEDPDAQLHLAQDFKKRNQARIDKLFAEDSREKRGQAVKDFFRRKDAEPANPVILDIDASVCSPSLRLMVLDLIGSENGPLDSADVLEISRSLIDAPSSEERVLALRNLARFSPKDRPMVAKRLRQIISESIDAGDYSFAFGQAFDGIVYLRDTEAIPLLARLMKDKELAPLAGAAMDRLAEADPAGVAAWLNAHPAVFAEFPLMRADYYAKGSLASAECRRQVEKYLQSDRVEEAEREKFFFSYLQSGTFLVSGIFTGEARVQPDGPDRAAELKAAVDRWEKEPAMQKAVKAYRNVQAQIDAESDEATPK